MGAHGIADQFCVYSNLVIGETDANTCKLHVILWYHHFTMSIEVYTNMFKWTCIITYMSWHLQLRINSHQFHVSSMWYHVFLLSESVGGRSLWAPAPSRRLVVCLCRWGCVHGWGRGVTDCEGSWHNWWWNIDVDSAGNVKHWKKPMILGCILPRNFCNSTSQQRTDLPLPPFFCVNILVHQALDLVHIRPSHNRNCHCQKAAQYVWVPKFDGERCGKKDVWSNLHVYENVFWHDGRSWVTVWKTAMKRKEWLTSWQLTQYLSWSGVTVEAIPMPSSEKWFGSLEAAKMCKTGMLTNNVSEKSL